MWLAKTTGLEEVKTTTTVHFQRESGILFDIFLPGVLKKGNILKFICHYGASFEDVLRSAW